MPTPIYEEYVSVLAFGEFNHIIIVLWGFFCKKDPPLSPSENIVKHTLIFLNMI